MARIYSNGVRRSSEKAGRNIARSFRVRRLPRGELPIATLELAQFLIGKTLAHDLPEGPISGRIVETEAYPPGDAAGHAFRGETPPNRSLFLKRGHAHAHFAYGSCWLINVTGERAGVGGGVLLRALEPLEGVGLMQHEDRQAVWLCDLARGPGRLAAALHIDKPSDGVNLCAQGPLWLGTAAWIPKAVGKSVRIGIRRAARRCFRFYERGNPCVSGPARLRQ